MVGVDDVGDAVVGSGVVVVGVADVGDDVVGVSVNATHSTVM